MIRCNLSRILGEKRLKVAEVARDTGINKNTIHRLYNESVTRIDIEVIDVLCRYLDIQIGDLFELVEDPIDPEI
ncbi:helix-turn-helix transcriptional regulator [Vibrio sp. 1-Bac 57]